MPAQLSGLADYITYFSIVKSERVLCGSQAAPSEFLWWGHSQGAGNV